MAKAKTARRRTDDGPERLRDLNRVFNDAHRHGTRALQAGDLKGFDDAIAVERSLIQEQREVLERQRAEIAMRRRVIPGRQPPLRHKRRKQS